jgi:flagellar motility protein MotE (MotC chaperone)
MAIRVPKIRTLPITIFVACLVLTVKISDIVDGVGSVLNGAISVSEVQAQTPSTVPVMGSPTTRGGGEDDDDENEDDDEEGEDDALAERPQVTDDPTLLTLNEIDLLQQLSIRRDKLNKREQEMEGRSGLLDAAEKRIDKKVQELKVLQVTIEKLLKSHEDQQNAKMGSLVKIYEAMKPKDAARIFEELDLTTLLLVAEGMKERKLAPVMAQMNPEKAKEMTVELTRLRELPRAGSPAGG